MNKKPKLNFWCAEIPNNCKHLVKEDNVQYIVPGDGCCGPNCAAAWLLKYLDLN